MTAVPDTDPFRRNEGMEASERQVIVETVNWANRKSLILSKILETLSTHTVCLI